MNIKSLILILALLTSCTSAQNKKYEETENNLKVLTNQLVDAQFVKHDSAILNEILSADFVEVMLSGIVNSREQSINAQKDESSPMRKINTQANVDDFQIRVYDKFAVVIAKLNIAYIFEGQPSRSGSARITVICHKEKDKWKIASSQFTRIISDEERSGRPIPPPPPPPKKPH